MNINKKKLYIEVIWYNNIKDKQILKRYIINLFYKIWILIVKPKKHILKK